MQSVVFPRLITGDTNTIVTLLTQGSNQFKGFLLCFKMHYSSQKSYEKDMISIL